MKWEVKKMEVKAKDEEHETGREYSEDYDNGWMVNRKDHLTKNLYGMEKELTMCITIHHIVTSS